VIKDGESIGKFTAEEISAIVMSSSTYERSLPVSFLKGTLNYDGLYQGAKKVMAQRVWFLGLEGGTPTWVNWSLKV